MDKSSALLLLLLLGSAPASAQSPARFTFDTSASIDAFRGDNAMDRPNIIIDSTAVVRLGDGWIAYVRPWIRQPRTTTWDAQIYQAELQYQHSGRVSRRIEIGYIASPVGLGMMDTRPSINPTILPHLSYFTPMPAFDTAVPRIEAIAATYPLGGQLTLSTSKWDARLALVDSAPTRVFVINGPSNPRATPVVEGGAGVTPKIGLRVGVSFAHGEYATSEELAGGATSGRNLTLVAFEGEYAFGYTKITGELTRDALQTAGGNETAYEWFVQGMQTLTPRWFVAARQEGVSAPPLFTSPSLNQTYFHTTEATLGYRLSPAFTLRTSFFQRKLFTSSSFDRQIGASIVWAHRWW